MKSIVIHMSLIKQEVYFHLILFFFTSPQMIEKTVFKSFKFLFSNMSIHLPLPLLHKLLRHLIENGKFLDD
ncbi:hypothetical protein PNK_2125 [Candidatus Protochlamydia naegleriophila]|uniref:Uncharacterized protein n=1 Tax=Candidatus Protochlamydia naegleriophila TaxID=389348 RepID=A0A0U5ETZ0_9BACT|nr:hypothetical protein PNK_2125 [Candidatus Protochlamydia naegleriophila]